MGVFRHGWLSHRLSSPFRIAALCAAGLLLAAAVATADSADAAGAAGYTTSLIVSPPTFPAAVAVNSVTDIVYLTSADSLIVVDGASNAVVTFPAV